jgi:kynurenine formamidase
VTVLSTLLGARVYDLEQPRYAGLPIHPNHAPGVSLTLHRRHERGAAERRTGASALLVMAEHTGTHIDALCHQAYDATLYGGVEITPEVQTPTGFTQLGIDTVEPIVRRGVLLDVAPCSAVGPDELAACDVEIREGDVVLVRLGSGALYGEPDEYVRAGGVTADGSRWLAARRPFAVGADNVAWDAVDGQDPELGSIPGHTIPIVQHGIHIIESLYLEELAADGVREFGFVCLPLKLRGGTGSPVRPIALV